MDGFERSALARLPLAEAVLCLWRWCVDGAFLNDFYERWRGRSYAKVLSFSTMLQLVADALLKYGGSARQSCDRAGEAGTLPASVVAFYGKLRRIPLPLSEAFLSQCTVRLRAVLPAATERRVPPSIEGFEVVVIDGKTIKRLAKRLKPLRGVKGGAVGGKTIVALSLNSGLALALRAHPDGHANDVRLLPDLLPQVRDLVPGARLWLGDRAYSYPELLERLAGEEDHFVIRLRSDITFRATPGVGACEGRDRNGRGVIEEWGSLGRPGGRHQIDVRRITLERGEEEPVVLVTNLLDEKQYPATDLLDLYLSRWGIERAFQQVTEVFNLQHLIGSSPAASVFQFSFCLVLFNMLQVVRRTLASLNDRPVETISTEKLFVDVREHLIAWALLIGSVAAVKLLPARKGAEQVRERLQVLLRPVWTNRWIKAPRKKPRPSPPPRTSPTHVSAHQLIVSYQQHSRRTTKARK